MDAIQAQQFIKNSKHALDHLFLAIDEYNTILNLAQEQVEKIEFSQIALSDLFMYRDQWSDNANFYYAQYVERMKGLRFQHETASNELPQKLESALASIGATVGSMSSLAGAILQIAKQILSLRHEGKPIIDSPRYIGSQGIIEVVWEGRNHAMHWDEGAPRKPVKEMLDNLSNDLGINIEVGNNNCLSILGALNWSSSDAVIADLNTLVL